MESIIVCAIDAINSMPSQTIRRNSIYYELLTYLNHMVAFINYKKYDEAVIFSVRGLKLIRGYKKSMENEFTERSKKCFEIAIALLDDNELITDEGKYFISRLEG